MPHKNPEIRAQYQKEYRQKNRAKRRQQIIDWYQRNRDYVARQSREYRYRTVYGITIEEFDRLLALQGGCCAVCKATEARGKGRFHVDHDHTTGKVRGILCHICNTTLGRLERFPNSDYFKLMVSGFPH